MLSYIYWSSDLLVKLSVSGFDDLLIDSVRSDKLDRMSSSSFFSLCIPRLVASGEFSSVDTETRESGIVLPRDTFFQVFKLS
jgi:hypothetical protein